jgi:hypothetical protein
VSTFQLLIVCVTFLLGLAVVVNALGHRRRAVRYEVDGREVVVFLKDGQSLRGVAESNGSATLHLHRAELISGASATNLKGVVHIAPDDTMAVQVIDPERAR